MLPNAETVVRVADVAAGWLLTYLIHSTIILLAVWAIASRRRVTDTVREILWKSALVGGIVTASLQTAVARTPLGGQLSLAPRSRHVVSATVRVAPMPGAPTRFVVFQPRGPRWTGGLIILWLTGAGAALLWLTFRHDRTLRALGSRVSLDRSPIGWRLRDLLVAAGVGRRVELTASSTLASPVALPGGEICLPRRALLELESGEQDSMLAHEVAHIVRRDPQWLIAARAIEAVLFFQPLNRLARRRMQEVAEYLCDDWAVARTSRPVMLAKCLAAVAEWVGRAPSMETPRLRALSAMVESHGSPLVRRVGRILGRRRAPDRRTSRIAFASATLGLGVIAAALPRVSIATPAGSPLAFVRERGDTREMVVERGLVLLRRIGTARTLIDSITRPSGGAMAGPRLPGGDVIVQRILIDTTTLVDTSGSDRHLRPILPPAYDPANHIRQRR